MKVTPLEIRQALFQKSFRGYDKDEVKAFLFALSQEWEKMMDEHKDLTYKLDMMEREVKKLREVENSLYKALKTAEETSTNLIAQATKTAELQVKEAELKSQQMLEDAERKGEKILQEMKEKAKEIDFNCRNVENYRDDLIADLKTLVEGITQKIERLSADSNKNNGLDHSNNNQKNSIQSYIS